MHKYSPRPRRDGGREGELMPPAGAKPKPQGHAVTRHALTHDWLEVENTPHVGGPDLPATGVPGLSHPNSGAATAWPQRTRDKWDTWRTMPHCKHWGPAEWDFALDSIGLAALYHLTGEQKYATELRNREKILGTTMDFRRSLRIRYVEPKVQAETDGDVVSLSDYRNL
ncbi:MAG: hypothetical protein CK431_04395 [Mycobacterium sp.]|nr:MAG: hypothetical protein CK431_04395 [Mycobacterium sp.]